jgi:hypothetical protein
VQSSFPREFARASTKDIERGKLSGAKFFLVPLPPVKTPGKTSAIVWARRVQAYSAGLIDRAQTAAVGRVPC